MAISGGGTPEGEMSVTSGKYVSDKNLKYFWSKLKNLFSNKQDKITSSNKLSKDLVSGLGTASTVNTGTSNGNVPVIGSNGKLPSSVIPASAITDTFVASSQSDMLGLSSAEVGDVCVRTDLNKTFILKATPYSTLSNWQELLTPTDAVTSVNGQTGVVNIAVATGSSNGLMSSTDKTKMDKLVPMEDIRFAEELPESNTILYLFGSQSSSQPAGLSVYVGCYIKGGKLYSYGSEVITSGEYQVINGQKNFTGGLKINNVNVATVNDIPTDIVSREDFDILVGGMYDEFVDVTTTQDVNGVKNFVKGIYQNGKEVANKEDIPDVSGFAKKTELSSVATSGSYNDLTNKPTIPTVNNGTLTIQKNGTSVGTFTANQSSASTINITVPTGAAADKGVVTSVDTSANLPTSNAVKSFVEGKGYVTSSGSVATATNATKLNNQEPSYYLNYNNLSNKPTIPDTSGFAKTSDLANYVKNNANQTIKGNSSDTPLILESATTSSFIGFKRNGDTAVWGYFGVNDSRKPTFYATKDEELALKSDLGTQATFSLSGTTLTITPK